MTCKIEFDIRDLIDTVERIRQVDPIAHIAFSNQTLKFYLPNNIDVGGNGWLKGINHHNINPVVAAGFTLNEMMSCTDPDTKYLVYKNHKFIYVNGRFADLGAV